MVNGPRGVAFEHVAFDLDGTLADTRADLVAAVNHVLEDVGRAPIAPDVLYRYVGDGARALVERALGPAGAGLVTAAIARFMDYYGAHLLDATRLYPGLEEALAELAGRGVALSVLTNKPEAMSRTILEGLGVARHFVAVLGGDSLPTRKPDPAGLELLRQRTGTPRERTLLVGDSRVDVETARAARVSFCGVAWGIVPDQLREANPERVVASAAELLGVVERG
ncbi:MAG: HAD-IA family hydrolase [Candidatus Binatia bacterium]